MRKLRAAGAFVSICFKCRLDRDAFLHIGADRRIIPFARRFALDGRTVGQILATDKSGATETLHTCIGVDKAVGVRDANLLVTAARLSELIFTRDNARVDRAVLIGGVGFTDINSLRELHGFALEKDITTLAVLVQLGWLGDTHFFIAAAGLSKLQAWIDAREGRASLGLVVAEVLAIGESDKSEKSNQEFHVGKFVRMKAKHRKPKSFRLSFGSARSLGLSRGL